MKNMKRSLVALLALVSASSMAGLVQPTVPLSENAPFRISLGGRAGIAGMKSDDGKDVYGFDKLGGGLGFTHSVGGDFEYGLSVYGGKAAIETYRIFTDKDTFKNNVGYRAEAALMARYMPELAEGLHLGAALELGVGRQLTSEKENAATEYYKKHGFADISVKLGPAMSYSFTDSVAVYLAPSIMMTNIRFGGEGTDADKKPFKNWLGATLPIGAMFAVTDMVGVFVEAEPALANFTPDANSGYKAMMDTFKVDGTIGVTFAL